MPSPSNQPSSASDSVTLDDSQQTVEFAYEPKQTGRFSFSAEIEPVGGEVVVENNRAARESTVRDDFLRLLFVEYEPTWEWRFVKEVFHRDKLVGERGFRTFLRSADPRVRETNTLVPPLAHPAPQRVLRYRRDHPRRHAGRRLEPRLLPA